MKEILKPALILLAITTVAAMLLGVVSETTKEAIAAQKAKTEQTAMQEVLPGDGLSFETLVDVSLPEMSDADKESLGIVTKVNKATKDGELYGFVITTAPSGFGGEVGTMVGIDADSVITGLRVLSHSETPGLGAKAKDDPAFYEQFTGKSGTLAVTKDGGEIQSITSATITSRTVTDGANAALKWVEENGGAN